MDVSHCYTITKDTPVKAHVLIKLLLISNHQQQVTVLREELKSVVGSITPGKRSRLCHDWQPAPFHPKQSKLVLGMHTAALCWDTCTSACEKGLLGCPRSCCHCHTRAASAGRGTGEDQGLAKGSATALHKQSLQLSGAE